MIKRNSLGQFTKGSKAVGVENGMFGKHHSDILKETRSKKYSGKENPFYGKHHSEETKKRISKANMGHVSSIKGKKMSWHWKVMKTRKKRNYVPWNKGKVGVYSKETLNTMRNSHLGSKSSLWKGGKTEENAKLRASSMLRNWRKAVFERDNFTCQSCRNIGEKLQAHHIKSWAVYPRLRFNISNGITLCKTCHRKTKTFAKYQA